MGTALVARLRTLRDRSVQRCIAHSRRQRAGGDTKKARVGVVLESEELAGPAILTPRTGLEKTAPGVKSFLAQQSFDEPVLCCLNDFELEMKFGSSSARSVRSVLRCQE